MNKLTFTGHDEGSKKYTDTTIELCKTENGVGVTTTITVNYKGMLAKLRNKRTVSHIVLNNTTIEDAYNLFRKAAKKYKRTPKPKTDTSIPGINNTNIN